MGNNHKERKSWTVDKSDRQYIFNAFFSFIFATVLFGCVGFLFCLVLSASQRIRKFSIISFIVIFSASIYQTLHFVMVTGLVHKIRSKSTKNSRSSYNGSSNKVVNW